MGLVILLLALLLAQDDGQHRVLLAAVETTSWTHVCTVEPVVYVRKQADGDIHITLDDGHAKVVAEIIPQIALLAPRKGQTIEVCGITRFDKHHRWPEVHPVTSWTPVDRGRVAKDF